MNEIKHAWNLFNPSNRRRPTSDGYGYGNSQNPTRTSYNRGVERTVVTSVYNRISLDASAIGFRHIRMDSNKRYDEDIDSSLNKCLTVQANIDQTHTAFVHDLVSSLLDEGCVAVVPVDTDDDIEHGSFKINSLRVGKIETWYPSKVDVLLYNDSTGMKETVTVSKSSIAIIENPFYAVMNEPNSTMQRLIRKLNLLDSVDEAAGSGKLDLIVQLPYAVRTETRREQAEKRKVELEGQLANSKYGVAYIDSTESVTQLNRSIENNLMEQIRFLTELLYSQLGMTQEILNGTADENAMNNYYNRIVDPILQSIVNEFNRKFLTQTARSQGQTVMYFRDPFKLIPVNLVAEIADKFTRNEILTSNEVRQILGIKPSDDPSADELRNKNLSQARNGGNTPIQGTEPVTKKEDEDNE